MKTYLLTGGAGFIGSNLAKKLLTQKNAVHVLDNMNDYYDPKLKKANLEELSKFKSFRFTKLDIRDAKALTKATKGKKYDAIIHLAARAGVRPSIVDPLLYSTTNVDGTVNMLEIAKTLGAKKFIFASSSSIYGNNKKVPFSEKDNVDFAISPYAATKKAGEVICHVYHSLYQINITCLRFFTVYGRAGRPDLAIAKFTKLIDEGKPIEVFGKGDMRRDFTYIDDIVQGIIKSINQCKGYNIYNLGESQTTSVIELIDHISKALGKKSKINHKPLQPGDVKITYADISKAKREIGYNPKTKIKDGIKKYVDWYLSNKK